MASMERLQKMTGRLQKMTGRFFILRNLKKSHSFYFHESRNVMLGKWNGFQQAVALM